MKHAELIARLEAAEVGSMELDAYVEVAVRAFEAAKTGLVREHWAVWRASSSGLVGDGSTQYASAPVTTSLDAALDLIGRALPDWDWQITKGADEMALVSISASVKVFGPEVVANTPATALCIAILRALDAQEGA